MTSLGLSMQDIVALYEYGRAFEFSTWTESRPTSTSLAVIKDSLKCDLPADLIEFAKLCPSYTTYFALLGDDLGQVSELYQPHILYLRQCSPGQYIHLAHPTYEREVVIDSSNPEGTVFGEEIVEGKERVQLAPSFRQYLEDFSIGLALGNAAHEISRRRIRELADREKFVEAILEKYETSAQPGSGPTL